MHHWYNRYIDGLAANGRTDGTGPDRRFHRSRLSRHLLLPFSDAAAADPAACTSFSFSAGPAPAAYNSFFSFSDAASSAPASPAARISLILMEQGRIHGSISRVLLGRGSNIIDASSAKTAFLY